MTLTAVASANSGGIGNYSGKSGANCGTCHTGGAAPTVAITGPTTLAAGAQGTYTLTVTTTLPKTGADIAASDGATLGAGTNLKASSNDVVQNSPVATASGAATYTFTATAPTSGTTMTLYGCGVGADGNGGQTGDGAAVTTLAVTVTGGSAAPAASSSSSSDTSTSSKKGDDDDDSASTTAANKDPWNDTQSCAATPGEKTSGVVAGTFVALALLASKRRRRK